MNRNFATVDENNRIVYAPDTLGRSLQTPKVWQYHNANYWEIDKTVPTAPEGKYARPVVVDGHEIGDLVTIQEEHIPAEDENGEPLDPDDEYKPPLKVVRQRYEFLPVPEAPKRLKRYSRKAFYLALAEADLYVDFVQWAERAEVMNGLTVKDLLLVSTYLQDGDTEFEAFRAVAARKFGEDVLARMLEASEDEEW